MIWIYFTLKFCLFPLLKNSCTVIKILYSRTCICGPVYSGHSVYYGHRTTSLNFQLPYIFCKVDLFIGVTLYITVTLPFPKGDCCTHVWLYIIEYKISIKAGQQYSKINVSVFFESWLSTTIWGVHATAVYSPVHLHQNLLETAQIQESWDQVGQQHKLRWFSKSYPSQCKKNVFVWFADVIIIIFFIIFFSAWFYWYTTSSRGYKNCCWNKTYPYCIYITLCT